MRKIEGVLSDGAKRWMGRIVWHTCLIGPLALPATFAVTQIALPMQFSMLGLDAGGRGGTDFPGAALELVARAGPA